MWSCPTSWLVTPIQFESPMIVHAATGPCLHDQLVASAHRDLSGILMLLFPPVMHLSQGG